MKACLYKLKLEGDFLLCTAAPVLANLPIVSAALKSQAVYVEFSKYAGSFLPAHRFQKTLIAFRVNCTGSEMGWSHDH